MKRIILLSIIVLVASGCAPTPQQQSRLQNQVFSVRQVQKKQDQTLKNNQNRLAALTQKIEELEERSSRAVSQKSQSMRSNQADIASRLESQRIKLATLTGTQEGLQRSLDDVSRTKAEHSRQLAALKDRLRRLEQDLQQVTSQMGIETEEKAQPSAQKSDTKTSTEKADRPKEITPDFLYEKGLQAFNNREYKTARGLWADMIKSFPEHELVPNAYFWQGEAYYQLQDFANAALKYNEVIEKYSKHNKYPAALLKQGLTYYALHKNRAGRLRLEELIKKFPDRAEAKRARIFLDNR